MYADIIVDISAENLDRSYQYLIPPGLLESIRPGVPVIVPFGRGSRTISGYVVGISDKPKISGDRIKPIMSIRENSNSIDSKMIALAWWMKEQFGSTMNEALHTVIPVSKKIRENYLRTIISLEPRENLEARLKEAERKKHVAKRRFLEELIENGRLDYSLTTGRLNISSRVISRFEEEGVIQIRSERVYRNPFEETDRSGYQKPVLNEEQKKISDSIIDDIRNGKRSDYLIHGITGSGKTEIYMEVIDEVLQRGRQVIMLIPEISLTYQTVKRFYLRFGNRISIINSRLSGGERYDQYLRAKHGEADIVIGPRSALFTPFERLGLIIIDEEHETSYISEQAPRYNSREVALYRGRMENACVILGSATPSLDSYAMANAGRLKKFTITRRAGNAMLPDVHVVDLREELKNGNKSIFSEKLQELIKDRLDKGEQTMLFLNRRGYSGMVSCRSCGHVIKCPHCDISLTLHHKNGLFVSGAGYGSEKSSSKMICHYCGHTEETVKVCPKCGSKYIGSFGTGTQKVEEMIRSGYPSARVLRLDADTVRQKNGYEEILSAFANEEADILVGTQMIVKGHDFRKCTLVGILVADMSLFSPDFRAGERTFQLLTQASGRAGRGDLKGDVVIQTYNPDHYCIRTAADSDYGSFFREEYAYRVIMDYPPARCMLTIILSSENESVLREFSEKTAGSIRTGFSDEKELRRITGPVNAPVYRVNDIYRRLITIKSGDYALLVRIRDFVEESSGSGKAPDNLRVSLDYAFN